MLRQRKSRPIGQPTRGKTALNRLRQVDTYIALNHAGLLRGGSPLVVDLGYGAYPWTTLEMRQRWLSINPRLRILGVEIDVDRVKLARPFAIPPTIEFKRGGFNIDVVIKPERARLIRAYNVLRQYEESAVPEALAHMGEALEPGGLLIEGTSSPTGRMVAFDVYERTSAGLSHVALVFGTNFREVLTPIDFQTILPKRLIHHMRDPKPAEFFDAWRESFVLTRSISQKWDGRIRAQWREAALLLRTRYGMPISPSLRLLRRGFVVLRDPLQYT